MCVMYHRHPTTLTWSITTTTRMGRGSNGRRRRRRRRVAPACCRSHIQLAFSLFTCVCLFFHTPRLPYHHLHHPAHPHIYPHARPHRLSSILIRSIRRTRITTRDRDVALKVGDTVLSGMKSLGRIAYSAAVPGGGWDCCVF